MYSARYGAIIMVSKQAGATPAAKAVHRACDECSK